MRVVLDNLPLKIASLLLAGLLWFVIAGEKTAEIGLDVPLELRNFPQELTLLDEPINKVEVRLRASPGILQSLAPGEVYALLDLSGVEEGERLLHLTPESIEVPFGVDVVKVAPSMLTLDFERTREAVVPVRPRVAGEPAEGYELAELTSRPAELRIRGPASRVAAVAEAFTEPISIEGARMSVTGMVTAGIDDPRLRILGERQVRVTARVRERHAERAVEGLDVEVRGAGGRAEPQRVDVVVSGPEALIAALAPADIRPWVDAAQRGEDGTAPVAVSLDGRFHTLKVVATRPERVTLTGPGR